MAATESVCPTFCNMAIDKVLAKYLAANAMASVGSAEATDGNASIMSQAGWLVYFTSKWLSARFTGKRASKAMVFVPACVCMNATVLTTFASSDRIGSKCCSPSLKVAPETVMRQITASPIKPAAFNCSGAKTKAASCVSLGCKLSVFCSESNNFSVAASKSCIVTCAESTCEVVFTTRLDSVALSPIRTKRGRLGIIMTSFFASVTPAITALCISLSCA